MSRTDVQNLAKQLRVDLTACQSRVTELLNAIADPGQTDEDGYLCPECGVRRTRADQLSEHRENVHGIRDWPAQPGYPEHQRGAGTRSRFSKDAPA